MRSRRYPRSPKKKLPSGYTGEWSADGQTFYHEGAKWRVVLMGNRLETIKVKEEEEDEHI
jgi:hypothetical protein